MSVSDSSPKSSKSKSRSAYGDGAIWAVKKPNGNTVWKVEITLGLGEDGKVKKTRRTASSKAEAIELRRVLNAKKLQGELQKKVSTRFEDFAIQWVREVKTQRVRSTTAADYEFRIRQYLNPHYDCIEKGASPDLLKKLPHSCGSSVCSLGTQLCQRTRENKCVLGGITCASALFSM